MLRRNWICLAVGVASLALSLGSTASASIITLSDFSSDATPASSLDATLDFVVLGGDTLQLTLTNDTTAPNEFSVNGAWWNISSGVTGLTLTSATHSSSGDVFAAWNPIELGSSVAGFGTFDFGLTDGVGQTNPNIIHAGQSIVFLMSITGLCADGFSCTMADFVVANENGYIGAGKFVSGPGDDSAFGAAVPEPGTAALFALGLIGMALRKRR